MNLAERIDYFILKLALRISRFFEKRGGHNSNWTVPEMYLLERYSECTTDEQLSKITKRTVQAIRQYRYRSTAEERATREHLKENFKNCG